ncbi:MAG: hypothetical protein D4R90_05230 [Nitrosopumilales archaeon]|nr:MAG: hypothetical protein D4R90_05230 [Nitrosopumilales archaeon]
MIKVVSALKHFDLWLERRTIDIAYKINKEIIKMPDEDNFKTFLTEKSYSKESFEYIFLKFGRKFQRASL